MNIDAPPDAAVDESVRDLHDTHRFKPMEGYTSHEIKQIYAPYGTPIYVTIVDAPLMLVVITNHIGNTHNGPRKKRD